ncbi:conserved hypothetical protein [Luminiphilus syltensis NOR5-1B]|uniref:PpiC domain-containing protein n=1 Tax=Luminiphilus syltensis NOR5-1B TaxID=565045 RepID=B8KQR1_9GAMM|nr:peptidylprolyl isomerase [Luminiphilus syltensis]EED36234.1 conserved hypothetical protein [Luminiphilus syltensis NOR5-1B]
MTTEFDRVWKRSPTRDELRNLVEQWVREEIFYREGLALGLDRKDSVLHQRVARRMGYIGEELIEPTPSLTPLKAWLTKKAEGYRLDPCFSFRQLHINSTSRGAADEAQVKALQQAPAMSETPAGEASLLLAAREDATLSDVRRTFGEEFAESLKSVAIGEWAGPVASGYGLHFVRVDSRQASRLPEYDEGRKIVVRGYLAERRSGLKERVYATLQERYAIVYEVNQLLAPVVSGEERVQ